MTLEGTIVNGAIVLDGNVKLPDGARVRVSVEEDEVLEYPHPLAPYDREKEIALLRERIARSDAGEPGIPLKEAMAMIAAELNLPPIQRE